MNKKLLFSAVAAAFMSLPGMTWAQEDCQFKFNVDLVQPTCNSQCNGSIILTPDPGSLYNFQWSNGATSNSLYNLCAGDLTVTITDDKQCSQSYMYSIVDPAQLVASCMVLQNETYPGANDGAIEASAVGGTLPYTYEWQVNPVVYGTTLNNLAGGTYFVLVYDANDCPASSWCQVTTDKKEKCEGFRTQTQGGWGNDPHGNNPGTYLVANFAAAFPAGLTIGCTRQLKLTSAQKVIDFLPSGSSPKVLPAGILVNPGTSYKNVFAGQLVAATLNVVFDSYDPNFGSSNTALGDMIINSGSFAGWTVSELLDEANKKIGGCASVYNSSTLSDALDKLNKNYDDGNVDNGYLSCPTDKKDRTNFSLPVELSVNPNPVGDRATVTLVSANDENIVAELFTVNGQKVSTIFSGAVRGNERYEIGLDASSLMSGIYFVRIQTQSDVFTHKIVIRN